MDPLSVPVLVGAMLNQAFGFLFSRLSSMLDHRREKSEAKTTEVEAVFASSLKPLKADPEELDKHSGELRYLMRLLRDYQDGSKPIRDSDTELQADLLKVRDLLEDVYGQDLTFRGEQRGADGDTSHQVMDVAKGNVTGVDTDSGPGAKSVQEIGEVEQGATVIGVRRRKSS